MIFPSILLVIAQVAATPSPSAQPSPTPLKVIGHVRTSILCGTLHHNLLPALGGLRVDDDLVDEGLAMLVRTADDAAANAGSETATGGASSGSSMDNYQLGIVSHDLAHNLVKLEVLLDDPHAFPSDPVNNDERVLMLAKSRLEAVVARQREALNVLSANVEVNAANDLRSHRDIIPYEHDMTGAMTPAFTPISMPDALAKAKDRTRVSEADIAPAMQPIVAACP